MEIMIKADDRMFGPEALIIRHNPRTVGKWAASDSPRTVKEDMSTAFPRHTTIQKTRSE